MLADPRLLKLDFANRYTEQSLLAGITFAVGATLYCC